jgi:3-oxoacyl-[acyl-carrier protein] reductase
MTDQDWVIVTGAAGAIGSASVRHFASKGAPVLALDRHFGARLEFPPSVVRREVDLLDESQVKAVLEDAMPQSANISLLINAVGLIANEPALAFRGGRLSTHSAEAWRRVIDANLTAAFLPAIHVAARMVRQRKGAIINFSSISGRGNPGQPAYSAAKAGIEGLTRSLAAELGPLGVRVNAVAPGFIDVPTTKEGVAAEKLREYEARTPLGRLGSVAELIGAIEFLASDSFVNGIILPIDGGLRL